MGVRTIAVVHPFAVDVRPVPVLAEVEGRLEGVSEPKGYLFENRTNAEAIVLNRLFNAKLADNSPKYTLYRADREIESGGKTFPRGSILIRTAAPHPYKRARRWNHSPRNSASVSTLTNLLVNRPSIGHSRK